MRTCYSSLPPRFPSVSLHHFVKSDNCNIPKSLGKLSCLKNKTRVHTWYTERPAIFNTIFESLPFLFKAMFYKIFFHAVVSYWNFGVAGNVYQCDVFHKLTRFVLFLFLFSLFSSCQLIIFHRISAKLQSIVVSSRPSLSGYVTVFLVRFVPEFQCCVYEKCLRNIQTRSAFRPLSALFSQGKYTNFRRIYVYYNGYTSRESVYSRGPLMDPANVLNVVWCSDHPLWKSFEHWMLLVQHKFPSLKKKPNLNAGREMAFARNTNTCLIIDDDA